MLRITAGKLKGQKYLSLSGKDIRPTSSRVREAIFNILSNFIDLEGISFLDLFSGSGGMGLEAYSRGASVCFVDKSKSAISLIKKNTNKLALKNIKIIKQDAIKFLELTEQSFDIIFMDPPYLYDKYELLLELAKKRAKFVLLEHSVAKKFAKTEKYKKWGDTALSIFTGDL